METDYKCVICGKKAFTAKFGKHYCLKHVAEAIRERDNPPTSPSINWTKWGTIIGVLALIVAVIGVLITLPTYTEDDDPYFTNIGSNNIQITNNEGSIVISKSETTDPEFTIINQEFVNCDALPNGLSGFSYINKSLGFMISWPDANWTLIEDQKSHRASYGLAVGESYLGGVDVSKDPGQSVKIAIFDKSDSVKNDFDKWLTLQAEGYSTKVVSGKANIRIDPDKNSATLEIDAMVGDDHFTMKERVLKNNDMIYLIQKHLFGMENILMKILMNQSWYENQSKFSLLACKTFQQTNSLHNTSYKRKLCMNRAFPFLLIVNKLVWFRNPI